MLRLGLAVLLCGAACRPDPSTNPSDNDPNKANTGTDDPSVSTPDTTKQVELHRAGAGHTANIDLVAVSADGKAAVTRDQIGGVRLWPSLDGEVEPIPIPERGAQAISVESRKGGHIVGIVDAAGGGKIFSVGDDGKVEVTGEMPPFQPLFELHALPGGNRLLALYKDHSVVLVDHKGKQIAKAEERRFRPTSLALGQDGKSFVAVLKQASGNSAELQRMQIAKKGDVVTIERVGSPTLVNSTTQLISSTLVISPDGKRAAWTARPSGAAWEIEVGDLTSDAAPSKFTVQIPTHLTPNLGFVGEDKILASGNDGTLSWLYDLTRESTHPRTASPQDFVNQGRASMVRGGTQVSGHGTWLFVHEVQRRKHRFLGYRAFQTQSVALSPSGEHVAWSYVGGPVFVEPLSGSGNATQLNLDPMLAVFRVRFFDDAHLITVGSSGALQLIEWRTGEVVAESGINGAIRNVHFEPTRGLLLVERHNNDARLFELSAKGFSDPYVIADQAFRTGLLAKGIDGNDKAVMWSLDSSNRMRLYTMKHLRSDLSREGTEALGKALPSGSVAPLAIDQAGRRYGVRWNGSRMELFVQTGEKVQTAVAPAGDVNQIVPSPDGRRFLAIHQRGNNASLSAHDSKTLEELWNYSTGVFNNEVVWSRDGRYVGIAANTGAAVLDGDTGESVRQRCGLQFGAMHSPPATAFGGLQVRSLCEG